MTRRLLVPMILAGIILVSRPPATPGATEPTTPRPTITLVSQQIWATSGGTVTTVLRISGAPRGAHVRVVLHRAVATRSAFTLIAQGKDLPREMHEFAPLTVPRAIGTVTQRFNVAGGTTSPATASPDEQVAFPRDGVYPLTITLEDATGSTLSSLVTFVVRLANTPDHGQSTQQPLRVGTQLRLDFPTSTTPAGHLVVPRDALDATRATVDGLAKATNATRQSLGFTISPGLVDALGSSKDRALARSLALQTDPGTLQRLPWAPLDLARWLITAKLAPELPRLTNQGTAVLDTELHAPDPKVADLAGWSTTPTTQSLTWLADNSTDAFLIPEADLSPLSSSKYTRTLAAPFSLDLGDGRQVQAVQLDADLERHFLERDPVLGANHLVADLAVLALDLPSMSRGLIVAPPVDWQPSAAFLSAYITDLDQAAPAGSTPLIQPTPINTVITQTPPARAGGDTATTGDPLVRTLRPTTNVRPLDRTAARYSTALAQVASLGTMAPGGTRVAERLVGNLGARLDAAMARQTPPSNRLATFAAVDRQVANIAADVELPSRQTITLTAKTGSLPVTIRRGKSGPTRVLIHLDSRSRLNFPDGTNRLVPLDTDTTHFTIRVTSSSPGDAFVHLVVTSPDSRITVGSTEMVVRSTTASGVGMLISFGSLGFLLIWWGRDIVRTRRQKRSRHVPPAELIDIEGT